MPNYVWDWWNPQHLKLLYIILPKGNSMKEKIRINLWNKEKSLYWGNLKTAYYQSKGTCKSMKTDWLKNIYNEKFEKYKSEN